MTDASAPQVKRKINMVARVASVMIQSSTSHGLRMAALGFKKKPLARIWEEMRVGRMRVGVGGRGERGRCKMKGREEGWRGEEGGGGGNEGKERG